MSDDTTEGRRGRLLAQVPQRLDPHTERAWSVRAGVDPRTLRRFLGGRPMRSTTCGRILSVGCEMLVEGAIPGASHSTSTEE